MPADSYTSITQMKIDDPMFAERIRAGDRSAIEELTTEEICKILEASSTNLGVLLRRGALLHRSNRPICSPTGSLSVSDRLRFRCSELEHAVEYLAGESGLHSLIDRVACA